MEVDEPRKSGFTEPIWSAWRTSEEHSGSIQEMANPTLFFLPVVFSSLKALKDCRPWTPDQGDSCGTNQS